MDIWRRSSWAALAVAVVGCRRPPAEAPKVAGTFNGGEVTRAEVDRESARMPPTLRANFDSFAGRRELARSLVDKKLLAREAQRRGLASDPEVRRQVQELEERLAVQALLAEAEKQLPAASEADERAWFGAHKVELGEPERLHLRRILLASKDQKQRAAKLQARLHKGADFAALAVEADGPERSRGGDFGLLARGDLKSGELERAAFALQKAGEATEPIETREGIVLLQLVERRPARIPSFEEARAQVRARMEPERKRKAFDALIAQLRKSANAQINEVALR